MCDLLLMVIFDFILAIGETLPVGSEVSSCGVRGDHAARIGVWPPGVESNT